MVSVWKTTYFGGCMNKDQETPQTKPFPPELSAVVLRLLQITADKYPDEIIHIGTVPHFWNGKKAGRVWVVIEGVWKREDGQVYANVRAITGKPFRWQGYHGKGWGTEKSVPAPQLRHVTRVQNRIVLGYYGTAVPADEIFPGDEAADQLSELDRDWWDSVEEIEF
jgi:hypothetical protein